MGGLGKALRKINLISEDISTLSKVLRKRIKKTHSTSVKSKYRHAGVERRKTD
jgi:hypothetical protein